MPNLTPDLDSTELDAILAQSERAASQPLGSSLLERLGGPEKAQELVEKLKTPTSPLFSPKYSEEAKKGAEFLKSLESPQVDPVTSEFSGRRARALSKQAAAAAGTTGEGVISNIETPAQRKIAEASAKAAKAAAGTTGEGVISDLPYKTVSQESPVLSKVFSLAKTPAGANILKALGITGKMAGAYGTISSLYGDLAEDQETPYRSPALTPSGLSSDNATSINPLDKQRSTPMYDVNTEGNIIKSALSQQPSLEYLNALEKRRSHREKYIDFLQNDPSLVDVEKERLLAAYDSKSPEQRALSDAAGLNEDRDSINRKIAETQSALAATNNQFASDRLNKQLSVYKAQLAKLGPEQKPESRIIARSSNEPSAETILSGLEQDADQQSTDTSAPSAAPVNKGIPAGKTATGIGQPTSADVAKQYREDELTKVIGKEEARKVSEYEDLMRRYQESQDRANQMRMMAGIGEGAELLGASIAGVKPADASFYRQMVERADLLPKQFKEAEDFKKEARRNDPNSEESKSARNFAKGLGYPVGESESAAELEKRFPIMERFQTAKENREARKETLALEKLRIDSEKEKSRQAKFTSDQNNFLDRERSRFAKDKVHEATFILKDALRAVDNYLRNPDPTAAQSLAYAFAKVNDPNSVVRESELKLFGKAGSLFDRFKQTIEMATKGQIPEKKALEFKNFISGKIQSAENDLKTKLSPIVEGGKRRGLEAQDVIESVAGPEYYQNLYSESGASAVKQTRQFDKKMTGMAGRTFTDNKTGKTYKVNLDETSATEI